MERVTIGRLIIGHGAEQHIIPPNTRFNTEDFGISDRELKKLDATQPAIIRRRQDFSSIRPEEAVDAAVEEATAAAATTTIVPGRPRASGRAPAAIQQPVDDDDL